MDQAVEALRSGNPADAEWTLRKHLLEAPRDAAALAKLAELVLSRNEIECHALLASLNPFAPLVNTLRRTPWSWSVRLDADRRHQ